ncbi:CLUMA_CG019153, isoform A [Clunio marinus]|uniref:CLUMA_CG019153, isoform A n=1 Tax=Clunio marinus TaxID=568069 RepID=A0A1J1J1W5_9DIPT|nr:CLUMA_CG019153, isoform A [Clunio marinus]
MFSHKFRHRINFVMNDDIQIFASIMSCNFC